MSFETAVAQVFTDAQALLLKKHHDYGPENISRAPGGPLNGLRVRMWDKQARLNNLVEMDVSPENESLRDTLVDLANYAVIGLLVLDGEWPGLETPKTSDPVAQNPDAPEPARWVMDKDGDPWERLADGKYVSSWGITFSDRAYLNRAHGPLTDLHSAPF